MRGRGLLVLAVLVAALAVFIGFYERKLPSSDQRREQAKHVLQVKKDAIDAITLERPGQPTVEIVRTHSPQTGSEPESGAPSTARWTLRKPWDFPAATDAVDGLLDALENLQQKRALKDFKPADLGLEAPRARVTVHTADGERTLEIGAEVPGFSSMAVRLAGGSTAYVVADGLWSDVDKKPGDWRSRQVLSGSRSDIQSVSWTTQAGAVTLAREGSEFRLAKPFDDVADQDRVDALMTALTGLRVDHFLDQAAKADHPAATGTRNAMHLRVALTDRPQPIDIELRPREDDGELTVRYQDQVAVCKSDLLQRLEGAPSSWRSRSWTTLHVYDIHQATIRDARGSVVLSRTDGGWTRDGDEIPFESATDLLDAVTDAKADTVEPAGNEAIAADKATITIQLQPLGGAAEQTLSLFADGLATNSTRTVRLHMPHDLLGNLRTRLHDLRAAKPTGKASAPAAAAVATTDESKSN